MKKDSVNWSSVAFMIVAVVCATVAFSLVLFREPHLLEQVDWMVAGTVIVSALSGLYQMARKHGIFKDPPDGTGSALVLLLVSSLALQGCTGASPEVRLRYSLEITRCIANEREIVDRPGTTYEQDTADIEAERSRCIDALRRIEGRE